MDFSCSLFSTHSFGKANRSIVLKRDNANSALVTTPDCCPECREERILDWTAAHVVINKKGKKVDSFALDSSEDEKGKKGTSGSKPSSRLSGTRASKRLQKDAFKVKIAKTTTVRDLKVLVGTRLGAVCTSTSI